LVYEHPKYERHVTKLLEGIILPKNEVEEFEIYSVNRKFFNGEGAVRMLERTLNIDSGASSLYAKQGYQNCHSTYHEARVPRQGYTVEEYNQQQYTGGNMLGKRRDRDYNSD
jgi:hypothetical protein